MTARAIRSLLFELGCALAAEQRNAEAFEAFERARVEPGDRPSQAQLLRALAELREASGELGKAFRGFAEAILAAPEQLGELVVHAHRVLDPLVAMQHRDWLVDTWLAQLDADLDPRARAQSLVLAARVALLCGELDQSVEALLERATQADGETTRAAVDEHLYGGRLPPMLAAADAGASLTRARIERSIGRLQRAHDCVAAALAGEIGDAREPALRLQGTLLAELGRTPEAASRLLDAGLSASARTDYRAAVADFTRACELDPELTAAAWELAEALRMAAANEPPETFVDRAIEVWSRAHAQSGPPPADRAWVYISRALLSERKAQGRVATRADEWTLLWDAWVFAECGHVLVAEHENSFWWATSARCLRLLDLRTCALALARRAVELGPENLSALDELSASLANLGQLDEAAEILGRRRKLVDDPWCRGVEAYLSFARGQWSESIAILDALIAEMPDADSFWHRDLRASAYVLVGSLDRARAEDEWIWTHRELARESDALLVAWAACGIGSWEPGLRLFEALTDTPQYPAGVIDLFAGLCELYLGDSSGARVLRGIDRVIYDSELHTFERVPLRAIAAWRPDLDPALEQIRARIQRRRAELIENPLSPIDELSLLQRRRAGSASAIEQLGLRTALARFELQARAWGQAASIYAGLLDDEPERFASARTGLRTAVQGLLDEGTRLLARGQPERALADCFEPALEWVAQLDSVTFAASVHASLAHAASRLGDRGRALRSWAAVASASPELGEFLGDCHRRLLASPSEYWQLDDLWAELQSAPDVDERLQSCLTEARTTLAGYLDDQLGGLVELQPSFVQPIVLELCSELIPESTDDWSLIAVDLPALRERIRNDTGVELPGVTVRESTTLPANSYLVSLFEVPVDGHRSIDGDGPALAIVLRELETLLRGRLDTFIGIDESAKLLASWTSEGAPERDRVRASWQRRVCFARVVRQLVRERVPILDGDALLAAIAPDEILDRGLDEVVELARRGLRASLPGREPTRLRVRLPAVEPAILAGLRESSGRTLLELSPQSTSEILTSAREALAGDEHAVVVVSEPRVRAPLRRLLELEFPDVVVIAADELDGAELEVEGD